MFTTHETQILPLTHAAGRIENENDVLGPVGRREEPWSKTRVVLLAASVGTVGCVLHEITKSQAFWYLELSFLLVGRVFYAAAKCSRY